MPDRSDQAPADPGRVTPKLDYSSPAEPLRPEAPLVPEWVKVLGVVGLVVLTLGVLYFLLQVLPRYP